jgi:pimeloyl-ACP methyl ester carboxylesterase
MGILGAAAGAVDRALIAAVRLREQRRPARGERFSHDERMHALAAIREAYAGSELWGDTEACFTAPPRIEPPLTRVRALQGGVDVFDIAWPSEFSPHLVREKYLAYEANRTARARLYLGNAPRPAIVLIHGYLAGQWRVEERAWPIRWLARRYDVALALLPFHALRAAPDERHPFPGPDPRFTNEGFRQAVLDLRTLVRFLRARGAPSVGVMGMSLGGYTAALLATIEPGLAFATPIIPLASLADFARDQGRLGTGEQVIAQRDALEAAHHLVSPFARPPRVPKERVLIVGAESDRITPIAHAERLAAHFGAQLVRMGGGHILQFGRGDAFRSVGRWIDALPT